MGFLFCMARRVHISYSHGSRREVIIHRPYARRILNCYIVPIPIPTPTPVFLLLWIYKNLYIFLFPWNGFSVRWKTNKRCLAGSQTGTFPYTFHIPLHYCYWAFWYSSPPVLAIDTAPRTIPRYPITLPEKKYHKEKLMPKQPFQ